MIKYYNDLIQGSTKWHLEKSGLLSASQIKSLMTKQGGLSKVTKDGKHTDGFNTLVDKIVAEKVSDLEDEQFTSVDMERGILLEPFACKLYGEKYNKNLKECGLVLKQECNFILGYSPDRLVGDDGLIEVKCPKLNKHIGFIIDNEVPLEYMHQIQTGLFVTERKWCDFVSFYDEEYMFVKRVLPMPDWQENIKETAISFCAEVDKKVNVFNEVVKDLFKTNKSFEDLAEIGGDYYG